MNILHVIGSLDPGTGGPAAVAPRIAAAQAALGHRVGVLSYDQPARRGPIDKALNTIPDVSAVAFHYLPPSQSRLDWPSRGSRGEILRARMAEANVLHLHGVWEPLLKTIASIADAAGKPYVVRPCGMLDPWSLQQKKWKKRLALALGYHRMLDRAAFLHCLNKDEKRLIEPLHLHCGMEVIPNGMFPQEIDPLPPKGSFYAKHPELNGQPFALFLSRLHYKKGLDYLADAFAIMAPRFPDVRLVVAGPDEGEREPFQKRVESLGISSRVHLVGPLFGPDKLMALTDATCFCLPSRQEGFSVAVTEALGCGVPVVISDACHFPEVAEAGAGEVVPLEPPAIAAALGRVLGDADLRARMSRAGREMVWARYTWPKVAEQTIDAYERSKSRSNAGRVRMSQ